MDDIKTKIKFEHYGYFALKDTKIHKQINDFTKKIKKQKISLKKAYRIIRTFTRKNCFLDNYFNWGSFLSRVYCL